MLTLCRHFVEARARARDHKIASIAVSARARKLNYYVVTLCIICYNFAAAPAHCAIANEIALLSF